MTIKANRRFFLSSVGALAAATVAGGASAQDVISEILQFNSRGNWDDTFDARASEGGQVASNLPIFAPQTVGYIQQAIGQYSAIVGQGGWPTVPATKKLQLGVVDPDVVALRKRLMVSGDLSQSAGLSESFDTYVDSAVKRFQARHGLPVDGVLGKYSYAAMNVSAQTRLGQLQTNLSRLQAQTPPAGRYVMVNIPAAQIEAVENGRVVLRHTAIVGKIDRQSPILNSEDQRDHRQSILERAGIDRPQGHHPADAQEPELSCGQIPSACSARTARSTRPMSTGIPRRRRNSASARIRARSTPWRR
jgi:murein L,D-transpeptidase YcbB/YkuD